MSKVILSLSGGLDSAVLLAHLINAGNEVTAAVSFDYGSKHNKVEGRCAVTLAAQYGVPHKTIDLSKAMVDFRSALLLSGPGLPEGHYAAETMRQTVVPFRNGIFLSVLAGLAESLGADDVAIGAHSGDHHIYPDCRPAFLNSMREAITHGTDCKVGLLTPFWMRDKVWIVERGLTLNVPFEMTRTCYTGDPVACGRCGSCQERLEAFFQNNEPDPLDYARRDLIKK